MKVPTDSFVFVKFGRDILKKNKSLVEDLEALHTTVTDEKTSREGFKKKLIQLRGLVVAYDALTAKLTEYENP